MASPLANVPGLAGWLQQQQMAQQQEQGQLQQFGMVQGLRNALAQQEMQRRQLALQEQAARAKANAPIVAPAGSALYRAGEDAPFSTVPTKEPTGPEIVQLQGAKERYLKAGVPADSPLIKELDSRIAKLNTPPAGVTVNMPGSSDTVQGQDGRFYKFQVGKDGQVRAVPIQTTTGEPLRPPQTPSERKAEQESKETIADLGEIERLGSELDTLVQKHQGVLTGVVGPQAIVGRFRDIAAGSLGADTPTIDFANKSKLFLSSVRKMVEKDPNLSNQERQNLMEAIGTGFWQTGSSSIRARQDVMTYVKNRRMATLKNPDVESAAKTAWGSYDPSKYEYRVVGGEVQRRLK